MGKTGKAAGRPEKSAGRRYTVRHPEDETQRIRQLGQDLADRADACGIVFCNTHNRAARVFAYLQRKGFPAVLLPGGKGGKEEQEAFCSGESRILVAASGTLPAAGRQDIRFVIHFNMPLSPDVYLKETGLAGLDGKGADCILYYLPRDRQTAGRLLRHVLLQRDISGKEAAARFRSAEDALAEMVRYCELPGNPDSAVREEILRHMNGAAGGQKPEPKKSFRKEERPKPEPNAGKKNKTKPKNAPGKTGAGKPDAAGEKKDRVLYSSGSEKIWKLRTGKIDSQEILGISEKITYADMMVADAVYSLKKRGEKAIYAKHVMELLSGNESLTLRPDRKQEIGESLQKLERADIAGLYEKEKDKIFGIPPEALLIPRFPTSLENLSMIHYLYCRICASAGEISLTEMWKQLGIGIPEETYYKNRKENTLQDKAEKILRHFADVGFIRGFSVSAAGDGPERTAKIT